MSSMESDRRWADIADWIARAGERDFELLGQLRTSLEDMATQALAASGERVRAQHILQALDRVILRELDFDEGMSAVRSALAEDPQAGPGATAPAVNGAAPGAALHAALHAARAPATAGISPAPGPAERTPGTTGGAPAAPGAAQPATGAAAPGKYLTVALGGESYAFDVLTVREIIALLAITPVPGAPACLRGVINLRGQVIPIVSLRARFGLPPAEEDAEACIVVVEVRGEPVGLIVDRVLDVVSLGAGDIAPAPPFGPQVESTFIRGIARTRERVMILLDVEGVLTSGGLFGSNEAAA